MHWMKCKRFTRGRERLTGNHSKIGSRNQEKSQELHENPLSPSLLTLNPTLQRTGFCPLQGQNCICIVAMHHTSSHFMPQLWFSYLQGLIPPEKKKNHIQNNMFSKPQMLGIESSQMLRNCRKPERLKRKRHCFLTKVINEANMLGNSAVSKRRLR